MKKILLFLMVFVMGVFSVQAQVGENMIADFETVNNLLPGPYTSDAGPANVAANPLTGNFGPGFASNTSANVLSFSRSGTQFPFLVLPLNGNAQDVASYRGGGATKQFALSIWTTAPAGSTVQLTLENKALATGGYPAGRQSVYTATTSTTGPGPTGSWERLVFTYVFDPDGSVSNSIIDQMVISLAPNTFVGQNAYIDNIAGFPVGSPPPVLSNEFLWTDFNGVDPVTFGTANGTFTPSVANPAQGPNHLLTNVARYERGTTAGDELRLSVPAGSLQNVANYTLGTSKFSFNVYSPAIGTAITLVLQNRGLALNASPAGRYATFTGTTTTANSWEKVIFNFGSTLNGCTISEIDEIAIRFNPGSTSAATILMDSLYGPTVGAGPVLGENMWDNFETTRRITYRQTQSDGTFTDVVANPSITAPNTSSTVGRYVRNGGVQFDVLVGDINGTMNNVAAYVAGTRKVTMKVFTTAPVGTVIELTFATAAASPTNYPTGRHSVYRAATTVQNGWQTLPFTYFFNPNSGADINQLQKIYIGPAANSFTNATYHFDDIAGPTLTPLVTAVTRDRLWSSLGGASNSLSYTGADGALTQAPNPAAGPSNSQPTVARYVRSTTQFDVLRWRLNAPPTNFPLYRSSANKFSIHVYSLLPTNVQFTLQNATAALGGYPTGRAAEFTGTHGGTGWEYVVLNYVGQPDPSITNANIDELAVLFNANSNVSRTIFCDSIYGPQFTAVPATAAAVQWKGSGTTDWNDANNWSGLVANWFPGLVAGPGSVPTSTIAAVIPNGATPYPAINAAGSYNTGDLTISGSAFSLTNNNELTVNGNLTITSGATPSIEAGSVLTVRGDITGGIGSAVLGGGLVQVTGNGNQRVLGTVTVPNFTLSKNGGGLRLTVGNTLRITPTSASSGILNLSGSSYLGNFAPVQNGGNVILGSNASGTAKLLINGSATYDGVITQERFVGNVGWHFVSMPFVAPFIGPNIGTLSAFSEAGIRIDPKNNANIFEYTEPDTTNGSYNGFLTERHGWKVPVNLTTVGSAVKGYRLYCNSAFLSRGGVLSTTGTPARNNINLPFTRSTTGFGGGGWNLVANPYSCEIDWCAVIFDVVGGNSTAPLDKYINIWNPALNAYGTFTATDATTGVGVNGATKFIGSSQAFFVKATGSSQILMREVHKVTTAGNTFLRQGAEENVLRFTLKQGVEGDEAALCFNQTASAGDDNLDAQNLATNVDMSSVSTTGKSLAINLIPNPNAPVRVPLNVNAAIGTASLNFSGISTFAVGTEFYLVDNFTGTRTNLATTPVVTFTITADPASKGARRFELAVAPATVTGIDLSLSRAALSVYPSPTSGSVTVALSRGSINQVQILNTTGQVVLSKSGSFGQASFSTEGLAPGIYTVMAETAEGKLVKSLVKE